MDSIGAYAVKTHLPRLLEDVATSGRSFLITRHGRPVARLGPVHPSSASPAEVVAALREARQGARLGDISIRELIEAGRG